MTDCDEHQYQEFVSDVPIDSTQMNVGILTGDSGFQSFSFDAIDIDEGRNNVADHKIEPNLPFSRLDSGYETAMDLFELTAHESTNAETKTLHDEIEDDADNAEPLEFVQDMEPKDFHRFEYSYRPSETIKNFYAGPSYWKFLKKHQTNVKSTTRSRGKKLTRMLTVNELRDDSNIDFRIIRSNEMEPQRKQKPQLARNLCRLPRDYEITKDFFEGFTNSKLSFDDAILDLTIEPEEDDEEQNFDEIYDEEPLNIKAPLLKNFKTFNFKKPPPRSSYNIKRIKNTALQVIENEIKVSQCNSIKFSDLSYKVEKLLKETSSSSCALTFLSLLQAANEEKINFEHEKSISDFRIKLGK